MRISGAVLEEVGRPRPFAESQPLTVSELELEGPGPGEILIKIEAASLCHSDLSVVDGVRPRPVPMLLGHEAAGTVVERGSAVTDLNVGDRVVLTFLPRCGECAECETEGRLPCSEGSRSNGAGTLMSGVTHLRREGQPVYHHLGVSGFADHAVVDRRSVVRVTQDIPPHIAALLGCAVLTGGGAVINAARPQPGQTTAVVGLGGVGMAALLTAIAIDAGPVIGVDMNGDKLAFARELGASECYTPQAILQQGITADAVIEAAGNPRAFETAVAMTAAGGTTVTVGLPAPDARSTIAPLGLVAEARTIVGSYLGSALPDRDVPMFASMWRDGRLPLERLISETISLNDINQAMDRLAEGAALRQVIDFTREERVA